MRLFSRSALASARRRAASRPLTADQIARHVQDRDTGRDSRAELRMKLFDRRDRVRERALTLLTLRGREAPGAPKTAPDGDRLLIRFTYPNDIRGTAFLVWEHPDGRGRALPLPAVARARPPHRRQRGAGELRRQRLLRTRTSAAASSTTTPTRCSTRTRVDAAPTARRVRPAGSNRAARIASAEFPRVVSLVLKDSFVVVQADVYNRRNEKQKVYTVRRLEQVRASGR